jgi:hypothetical protein
MNMSGATSPRKNEVTDRGGRSPETLLTEYPRRKLLFGSDP